MDYRILITNAQGESRVVPVAEAANIAVLPGDKVVVMDAEGNPVDVSLKPDDSDLVIEFEDGEKTVLGDFYKVEEGASPITISLNPTEPVASDYEFTSQTGNLPNSHSFTLMRYSNTGYIEFVDQIDDFDPGLLAGSKGGGGGGGSPGPFDSDPSDDARNLAPEAVGDSGSGVAAGPPIVLNLLANDVDAFGGGLEIHAIAGIGVTEGDSVTLSTGTVVTVSSGGRVRVRPGESFDRLGEGESATESFSYTIRDAAGNVATSRAVVTISGVNDPPVAEPDLFTVGDDAPATVDVLQNDSDPDTGDTLVVTAVTSPTQGLVTLNPDSSLTFDPNGDFDALAAGETETVTVEYTLSDDKGATAIGNATFVVEGSNAAPVAADDAAQTAEKVPVTIDVLGNDTDPDGSDSLTIVGVTQPTGGTVSHASDDLVFDPSSDFDYLDSGESATVTFEYAISDGNGGTDTATVTVTVVGEDDPTVTAPDAAVTSENTAVTIDVLANDSDPDASDNPLAVASVTQPSLGSVTNNGGDVTFDPGTDFDNLAKGESATVTFSYTTDTGVTENATVTVNGVNDAPTAVDDAYATSQGTPVTMNVVANDTDPDAGDSLSITGVNQPAMGSVSVDAANRLVFDPGTEFDYLGAGESATQTFDYAVSDGNGGTDTATVTVTINGEDDPTVTAPDAGSTDEINSVTVDVLANDSDADSSDNPLAIQSVTQPTKGSVSTNGSDLTFDPGTDFERLNSGETETVIFSYTTSTGVTEQVSITVSGLTNLEAKDDEATTDEDTPVIMEPLANDVSGPGLDPEITHLNSQSVSTGDVVVLPSGASLTLLANNEVSYDPAGNFEHMQVGESITETFTYEVSGDGVPSSSATGTIVVQGVNDPPSINTLDITTHDGAPVLLDSSKLNSSDPDHPDPAELTYNVDQIEGGYFAFTSDTGTGITTFTQEQVDNGEITFVPTADAPEGAGGGHIDVDTYDSTGKSTGHVHEYDDKTNLTVWNYFGLADNSLVNSIDEILLENPNIDGSTKFKIIVGNADLSPGINVTVNENYSPEDTDSFIAGTDYDDIDLASLPVYSLDGVEGSTQLTSLVLSASRNVLLEAGLIPSTTGDVQGNEPGKDGEYRNGAFTLQIVQVNEDGTDAFTTDTGISNGGVQGVATDGIMWETTLFWHSDLGTYDSDSPYVPGDPSTVADAAENDGIYFELTVSDPLGLSDTDYGTVDFTSEPPEAQPDAFSVDEYATIKVDLLANDTDPTGDDLTVTHVDGILLPYDYPVTLASGATVTLGLDGKIEYTASDFGVGAGETATDTFVYTVRDSKDATATETVTVTINGVDDPTTTAPDAGSTDEDTPVTVDVLANDSDPDAIDNPLSIAGVTQPASGTVVNNGSDLTFDPGADFQHLADGETEVVTFQYTTDTGVTEDVTVTVTGVNDAPTVVDDFVVSTTDIDPVTIDVLSNDSDVDGVIDPASVDLDTVTAGIQTSLTVAGEGVWTSDGTGKVTFTPDANLDAQPSAITYQVTDDFGATGTATLDLKYTAADVWFGNDESGSVDSSDFDQSRALISGAADLMSFAPNNVAFNAALFTWADSTSQALELGLTSDKTAFVNDSSTYSRNFSGGTDIGAGIVFGTQQIVDSVSARQAVDDPRADVPQVMVIMTDAMSTQILDDASLLADAQAAKDAGIILVFVAIQEAQEDPTALARLQEAASPDANGDPLVVTAATYADIDATEIADLLDAIREASAAGLMAPVVIDLDGDGAEFDDVENGILFDADGDGDLDRTAWASEDDAVLVYDRNGNDDIDGLDEVAFSRYSDDPNATDLEGLRHFDSNEDLILDANDDEFESFKLWQDIDGDGTVGEGEMMTLGEAGIESLELVSDGDAYYTAGGDVLVHGEAGVNYADGSRGTLADAEFSYEDLADDEQPLEILTEDGQVVDLTAGEIDSGEATQDLVEEAPEPADDGTASDGGAMPPTTAEDDMAAADAAMS